MESFEGTIEATSPGGSPATGVADNNGAQSEPGGTGTQGTIDLSQLNLSTTQMQFTRGDALALTAAGISGMAAAISASSGSPVTAVGILMGAFISDARMGSPLAEALAHMSHDLAAGVITGATAAASSLANSPVNVLGLYNTTSTINVSTGILNIDTGNGSVKINMYNGANFAVAIPLSEIPGYAGNGGLEGGG